MNQQGLRLDSALLKRIAKLLVAGALVWSVLRRVEFVRMWELVQRFEITYLVPVFASLLVVLFFRALRWQLLVSAETPINFRSAYATYGFSAIAMSVWPGIGELGRAALLRSQNDISVSFGVGVVVLEKLIDSGFLVGILGWAFIGAMEPGSKSWSWLAMLFGPVLLWLSPQVRRVQWPSLSLKSDLGWFARPLLFLKSTPFIRRFAVGLLLLVQIDRQQRCRLLLMSSLIWIFNYLIYFWMLQAYGVRPAWHAAGVLMTASFVGLSVAVVPGGLGTLQWAAIAALAVVGLSADLATVLSFTVQFLLLPITIIWGLMGLWLGQVPISHSFRG